jgi:hypothetical protein
MPTKGFDVITVKETTYDKLGQLAEKNGISRAKMVQLLLDEYERKKKGGA